MRYRETIELGRERVVVRNLRRSDRSRYVAAVNSLSPRSRYLRFGSPIRSLSEATVDRLMDADGERHVVLVAVEDDAIVAVGRYVIGAPRVAELALAVTDRWQGRGLGRAILERLVRRGSEASLSRLEATTLAENHASRRLLKSAGFAPSGVDGRMVNYRLELGSPR
jgi:RimJ/RimL family protein N-acetyltransferase